MIYRLRAADPDKYGDPATPARAVLNGCRVAPRSSAAIDTRGRGGAVEALALYSKNRDLDIRHTDHIEVDGVTFRVDGVIARWTNGLSGRKAGVEVPLIRGEG